mmetsp:Transcript_10432/g.29758  ORF Transcript_10432/g.29758 Transcript_10432/m.29758 type:complete len:220 (-) Transcript_10432:72-731(-)
MSTRAMLVEWQSSVADTGDCTNADLMTRYSLWKMMNRSFGLSSWCHCHCNCRCHPGQQHGYHVPRAHHSLGLPKKILVPSRLLQRKTMPMRSEIDDGAMVLLRPAHRLCHRRRSDRVGMPWTKKRNFCSWSCLYFCLWLCCLSSFWFANARAGDQKDGPTHRPASQSLTLWSLIDEIDDCASFVDDLTWIWTIKWMRTLASWCGAVNGCRRPACCHRQK